MTVRWQAGGQLLQKETGKSQGTGPRIIERQILEFLRQTILFPIVDNMPNSVHADWQQIVQNFADEIAKTKGLFSVKDVCNFLLHPFVYESDQERNYAWQGKDEVVSYLEDYLAVSKQQHAFHSRWKHLGNMEAIANHELSAMHLITKLLRRLQD